MTYPSSWKDWLRKYMGSANSDNDIFLSATGLTPQSPRECGFKKNHFLIHKDSLTPQLSGECGLGKWHIPIRNWIDSPVTWRVWTRKLVCSYPRKKCFLLPWCLGRVNSERNIFLTTSKLTPQLPGECGLGKWHIPVRNWIDSPVT